MRGKVPVPDIGKGTFHTYQSKGLFSVPSKLWRDSAFPFKNGDVVEYIINKKDRTVELRKVKDHSQKSFSVGEDKDDKK